MSAPIFSRPRFLPGSKINGASINHAIVSEGCILNHATITHSIIGLRCKVGAGTTLNRVILLGSDYFESQESIEANEKEGKPRIGIGSNCRIEQTIVDKNARIGHNVVITPYGKPENVDHPDYYIRDGIVIIPKNGVIRDGTVI
jgi:glucose-1-phosphate adenylyltransferase